MTSRTIYALVDPRDGLPRYVGATANVERRLRAHRSQPAWEQVSNGKAAWIGELRAEGLVPLVQPLEVIDCGDMSLAAKAERAWIERLTDQGCPLLNVARPYLPVEGPF